MEQWDKVFSDGTGRRKTALHNLDISIIDEERMRPLILSTSIILKGETSEQKVDAVMSNIVSCGKRLQQWEEVLNHSHPSYQKNTPDPSFMNIGNLESGGALTSEKCNGARKTRRLIVDKVHEAVEDLRKYNSYDIRVLEVDCWNHLRNVWLGGTTKALSILI